MSFDTVLVANRGEIAVRIIDSARSLGLKTVAVHSEADRGSAHVHRADDAVCIGPDDPARSYLSREAVLDAALRSGAGAIHPGYGFLSEDPVLAEEAEAAGLVFVGPTPDQLRLFAAKHTARTEAVRAGVPVFAGSALLPDAESALEAAASIGYPVMLKATGGGGGIGMRVCHDPDTLAAAFPVVRHQARSGFATDGVFVERYVEHARHVEVQIFGDGTGRVLSLGDRDCSLQRRHQKVLEEAPAPDLPDEVRRRLHASARGLAAGVGYRSAGTVEFLYDPERREASFLEVNARLQVEHPVTETVTGVDLVAWMLRLARGERGFLDPHLRPGGATGAVATDGHAVEARVYAEDPAAGFRPSTGTVTGLTLPEHTRVDTWVETGTEVTPHYDPLLAKIVVGGPDRATAWDRAAERLGRTRVDGLETNLGLLRAAAVHPDVRAARHSTATLAGVGDPEPRIGVERPGLMTTVQDTPGRVGHWKVGVPPSGAMDDLSLRLGNTALGNPEGAPGLECTVQGPALRFSHPTTVCVTGAPATVTADGREVPQWEPVTVPAGALLDVGTAHGPGQRVYVLVAGGIDVPSYLGSTATFTLGRFGGHGGRALVAGDVLRAAPAAGSPRGPVPEEERPAFARAWDLAVTEGPHGAPEFFTRAGIDRLLDTDYTVHFNSSRTGVRLEGPAPEWARPDGGEAGLHPSNIHDTPYAVGALDFTGDTPVLLGPDGPSLGGFVCPVTVVTADRWKLGQLSPGDTVRLVAVRAGDAPARTAPVPARPPAPAGPGDGDDGILHRIPATDRTPDVVHRRAGDDNVLVEYGPMVLDLGLRARVHALHTRLEELTASGELRGVLDLTPGVRSLQVHTDPDVLDTRRLTGLLAELETELPATDDLTVPSRLLRLPLSWDDPATREAVDRYMSGVRDDAPWCPWNIEFIRRVNGLDHTDDVYDIVFGAEYLVLGLGDVYLGAPLATPLDPRHRLVTTKYNPARTWTAENSVGIGGAYLCIYGMEGPGGYQFVGRTTQVWSRHRHTGPFEPGSPWLLRFFDRISWYPVGTEELADLRADTAAGRARIDIEHDTFSLAEHRRFLERNADSIDAFRGRREQAFAAERAAWTASGESARAERAARTAVPAPAEDTPPEGSEPVSAPFTAGVWRVHASVGDPVGEGDPLVSLEAMKTETVVRAPVSGTVSALRAEPGTQVGPGALLAAVTPAP
ncbi:urea carboxylase [Nocardiopsis sp. HNM0947]|uniref:Urea carboxylase n=1 Tax=Nocardiopsis coralli TaxID=2772213 RepID=A0ABR9P9N7_9ACTN|nr:urea carboxylase [Nocardiopsis coralli]MBE3000556.1 urea carboxylase [Nocardiopsis coralli]